MPDLTSKNTWDLRPDLGPSRFPGHSVIKIDCKTVVFLSYSPVAKRASVFLAREAPEPHTLGRVSRKNDCRTI